MKIADQLKERMRLKHYSLKTEQAYLGWYLRFVRFHGLRHPAEMGAAEVEAFLTDLAVNRHVGASTQNQALNALVFLYAEILKVPLGDFSAMRARRTRYMPVVLTPEEVRELLAAMQGVPAVQAGLLYGCGLRMAECLRLRIKDVDMAGGAVTVNDGKGGKGRILTLPTRLREPMKNQLEYARRLYDRDVRDGHSGVDMPGALAEKAPSWARSWEWFWVFPGAEHSTDPRTVRTSYRCPVPSTAPCRWPKSPKRSRRIPSATVTRRTC